MDFALSPEIDATRKRIREFVETRIIPLEADPASYDEHENIAKPLLEKLRAEAKAEGLWALGMPKERGGQGFSMVGLAACYEGCELLVSNDTGPLHLAGAVGTPTVGVYWVGNLINGATPLRARHRPIASWTTHCPVCGVDCTPGIYPHRPGDGECPHRDSFVADVPVVEVVEAARELLRA